MKNRLIVVAMLLMTLFFSSAAYAATTTPVQLSPEIQADIVKNVKDYNKLAEYLINKGLVKTFDDFRNILENNKPLLKQIKPTLIDYGFTTRQYAEVYRNIDEYDIEMVPADHGQKEVKPWGVYVTINNTSNEPIKVSKETFMLVPRVISEGQELYVLGVNAEGLVDPTNLAYLNEITIEPGKERTLRVDFYVPVVTMAENVNLRVYDGKDHVDLNLTK